MLYIKSIKDEISKSDELSMNILVLNKIYEHENRKY